MRNRKKGGTQNYSDRRREREAGLVKSQGTQQQNDKQTDE